ncbi:class I SAM-dependent methyltransferase, partial [bacterium]|nr:class I SAM-dependent methyltransferase [bacterium]
MNLGACAVCGHVMITTPYDDALISRIYLETPQDEVFWGEEMVGSLQPYRDMADFCGADPRGDGDGIVVDLGCGTGNLLRVLS